MDAKVAKSVEAEVLPLGVHIGLPFERYLADPGLGSSSLKRLARDPLDYWWHSAMNPARPRDDGTRATRLGTAMHRAIFDGMEDFDRAYMRGPDQDPNATPAEKGALTKKFNMAAASSGRECLPAEQHDRVRMSNTVIARNRYLRTVFTGGHAEVSVFWADPETGVRLKARYDYLKAYMRDGWPVAGIGDLKSIANEAGDPLRQACRWAIKRYRYDVQAAHYLDGFPHVQQAARENRVFLSIRGVVATVLGGIDASPLTWQESMKILSREDVTHAWQWVFHQTEGAPLTYSMTVSPGSPILDEGRRIVRKGIETYAEWMAKVGATEPWVVAEAPEELDIESMPWGYGREAP